MSTPVTAPEGILILDKPAGMTSHDCVAKMRRLFQTRKVGHTGTLDPMATGVLPVLFGRAAKAAEYLVAEDKHYIAGLRLGITTDTEDTTGTTLTECDDIPEETAVLAAIRGFVGEISQVPPMYSALKVDGQKLCDLARQGITVERKARPITVFSITAERVDDRNYSLDVCCSKGTYIRTLCADIGAKLGCGGVMATLERTEACGILIDECHTLDELEALSEEDRKALLLPTERLFAELDSVKLPAFFEKLFRDGCPIYQKKIKTDFKVGQRVRVCSENGHFFALGEVVEREEGSAIRSVKIFEL